jgi:hypothetical protein
MSWPANRARLILVFVALGIALGTTAANVHAQTTAETGVSITIVDDTPIDDGDLAIAWATENAIFLAGDDAPALTAANPSATVSATFALTIDDTRADPDRSGYTISLRAGAFTAADSASVITPDLLAIANVTGLPEGASPAMAMGQALDTPVTILSVPTGADPVATTVTVTVTMTLPPGTMPGTYRGGLAFDVVPLTGP